jgi:hypothetical protein
MQAQTSETEPHPEGMIETIQRAILHILVGPDRQRPWAFDEIIREYKDDGDQADVEDALSALTRMGLIHAVDGCYVASRSAVHVFELGILSI